VAISFLGGHFSPRSKFSQILPQKPKFWGVNRHFKPNLQKIQISISSKLCIGFLKFDKLMQPITEASWVVLYEHTTIPRWRMAAIHQKSGYQKSKMADDRHLEFWKITRKSAADWDIGTKFCVVVDINSGKSAVCLKLQPEVNSRWRRPPFWTSFLGHNLDADQHCCAKFGSVMENQQSKLIFWSIIIFSKIQHGGRPPSWIYKSYYNSVVNIDNCTKFCKVVAINSGKSAVCYK